ncbi:unnamed protein product [Macrosiphum euphorbiae]|uniref:Uncharacterized protein n=1 Tax=Macrosiphum euphorbiae TaxID=13131 RepID=A0AAV0WNL7_9HEMI|nr:unnamed protein product [Macrosiphum euphorbiae]
MDTVISTISYIRKNGLAHRQFQQFLEEIEAEYVDVIYFTEFRWLSRGAALKRFFFTLREEINIFMNEKEKNVPQLSDKKWIIHLAFLTYIARFLNESNVKLQGKEKLLPDMYSDIKSFTVKLKLSYKHIEKKLDHFVCCKKEMETFQQCNWEEVKVKFMSIIEKLQN